MTAMPAAAELLAAPKMPAYDTTATIARLATRLPAMRGTCTGSASVSRRTASTRYPGDASRLLFCRHRLARGSDLPKRRLLIKQAMVQLSRHGNCSRSRAVCAVSNFAAPKQQADNREEV